MTLMERPHLKGITPETWGIAAVFLAACVAMLPMLVQGVPDGFDLLQHMRFAAAYHEAILSGDLIPAWAGSDNFGYGSIGVRYYPPLAYIMLALGKILSDSWYLSFLANSFAWMLLGSIGVYRWAREWVDVPMAVFAAALYAVAPYHTFQIYQAVLFAEFAAAGIVPFCFLHVTRVCRNPNRYNVVMLSVWTSLLLLTHIPSTIIGCAGLGVYAVLIIDRSLIWPTFRALSAAAALTIGAASFHWAKLVTETSWVQHNLPGYYASGYYDYHRYFFPMYLISPTERYVERLLWLLDSTIVLTVLFAVPAIFLIVRRRGEIWRYTPLVASFVLSILLLSLPSSFIWDAVPVMAKLQFPWRWLMIATVVGPVLFVSAISWFRAGDRNPGHPLVYLTTVFVILLGLFSLTQNALQSTSLTEERFTEKVAGMNAEEACSCWWPVWARSHALTTTEKAAAGSRVVSKGEWANGSRSVVVENGEPTDLRMATFYHPYWKATVNGLETTVSHDEMGAITVALPEERATIELTFREPTLLSLTKGLSILTWLVLIGLLVGEFVRHGRRPFLS